MSEAQISRRGLFRLAGLGAAAAGLEGLVGCMTHPIEKAHEAFSEGDYVHSILWLDEAIEHNPRNAEAYYARGRCYFNLRQVDKAINDYDLAIQLDDSKANYYTSRGFARYQKGLQPRNLWPIKDALADFEKSIKIDPKHTDAYVGQALTNDVLDKPKKAYEAIQKAKQLIKDGHPLDTINKAIIQEIEAKLVKTLMEKTM